MLAPSMSLLSNLEETAMLKQKAKGLKVKTAINEDALHRDNHLWHLVTLKNLTGDAPWHRHNTNDDGHPSASLHRT